MSVREEICPSKCSALAFVSATVPVAEKKKATILKISAQVDIWYYQVIHLTNEIYILFYS